MRIDFWFDPICPWCWATSRWLVEVAPHRDLDVRWRPISLWRLNSERASDDEAAAQYVTHRLLRVCMALEDREGNAPVGRLYTVLGTAIHHDRVRNPDARRALAALGYDEALAVQADNDRWDAAIADSMDEGIGLAGSDLGTPLVGFDGRAAYFGPIVGIPTVGDEALKLFDAVATLATQDGFFELKRSRPHGPQLGVRPDVPHLEPAEAAEL